MCDVYVPSRPRGSGIDSFRVNQIKYAVESPDSTDGRIENESCPALSPTICVADSTRYPELTSKRLRQQSDNKPATG
jgi:hypothetical protein